MPISYKNLKDSRLVEVLKKVPYFEIFPEEKVQEYIETIAKLPDDKKIKVLTLLKTQAKSLPKLTEEEKIVIFESELHLFEKILKKFRTEKMEEGEKIDKKECEKKIELLLQELEKL